MLAQNTKHSKETFFVILFYIQYMVLSMYFSVLRPKTLENTENTPIFGNAFFVSTYEVFCINFGVLVSNIIKKIFKIHFFFVHTDFFLFCFLGTKTCTKPRKYIQNTLYC